MERYKLNRLNVLFEKMMAEKANLLEKRELNSLYQEFIDDGRDDSANYPTTTIKKVVMN
jgi:hypothetical protein